MASTAATTAEMADALAAFHFPDDLWARVDLRPRRRRARSEARRSRRSSPRSCPIYFGRVGSFVIENRHITTDQAEERVERQAREFELLKPYLVERWNGSAEAAGGAAHEPGRRCRPGSSSRSPTRRPPRS